MYKNPNVVRIDNTEVKEQITEVDDRLSSQLAQKAPQTSGGLLNDYWFPPLQQNGNQYVGQNVYDPMRYYNDMWDMLMNKHPEYINRTELGKDTTNTYPIYKYVFEPKSYEKTIIITGFVHGEEIIAQKNLFNFVVAVADTYDTHPSLTYMREKVRMVIVPSVNPWGTANNSRQNANNVDLNRNWDYGWNSFNPTSSTGKGSEPFSEKETQILKSVIEDYPDASALIDTHNTPSGSAPSYYVSTPAFGQNHSNLIMEVANVVSPIPNPSVRITQSIEPTLVNYAGVVKGLNTVNIEWVPANFGNSGQSEQDMTEGLKFLGNIIMKIAKLPRVQEQLINEPKAIQLFSNEVFTIESTSPTEIPELRHSFNSKSRGLIHLQGHAIVSCSSATNAYLSAAIIQSGDRTIPFATQRTSNETYLSFSGDNSERKIIPVNAIADVFPTGEGYGTVGIAFFARTTDGSRLTINRFRANALFLPTHGGESALRMSVSSGSLLQVYPVHPE